MSDNLIFVTIKRYAPVHHANYSSLYELNFQYSKWFSLPTLQTVSCEIKFAHLHVCDVCVLSILNICTLQHTFAHF